MCNKIACNSSLQFHRKNPKVAKISEIPNIWYYSRNQQNTSMKNSFENAKKNNL